MRKVKAVLIAVGVALTLPVLAGTPIPEVEPNDAFGTAQLIARGVFNPTGSVSIRGKVKSGDVDYFQIPLLTGDFLAVNLVTLPNSLSGASALGLFDPAGSLVAYDLYTPNVLAGVVNSNGNWRVAVSGFPDVGSTFLGDDGIPFNGSHAQDFEYLLTISLVPVPEPGGLLALGTGIAGLLGYSVRRRRTS